jgi:hypothetical protein
MLCHIGIPPACFDLEYSLENSGGSKLAGRVGCGKGGTGMGG